MQLKRNVFIKDCYNIIEISKELFTVSKFAIIINHLNSNSMTPAYCKLVICPHCGSKKEIIQLMSGNTFGAVLWSDTKQVAPMLPKASPIQKCPTCNHYFLLNEAKSEEGNSYSFEKGWLSFEESLAAFNELNNYEAERLELLTIIITWAYNDIVRNNNTPSEEQFQLFKNVLTSNLQYPIFKDNELFRGELYREIGEYDKSVSILNKYNPESDFLAGIKKDIINNAKNHNNSVFIIER